ncbi:MAG: hypothetical protein HQ536_00395 [Parcubacteria group bacterium]|nr:hypothetical protein [Parcubacteria group bacterium]
MKKIIFIILVFVVLGGGIWGILRWNDTRSFKQEEEKMLALIASNELRDDYDEARKAEAKIKETPDILLPYIQAGFAWKILADSTREEVFYKKATDVYKQAIDHFEMQYYMPYANLASIYQTLGEFEKTEEMLKKALQIVPGEAPLYTKLAELYHYDMNKTPEEVLAVYDEGIERGLSAIPLMIAKAAYLRDIGQLEESIVIYEEIYAATGSESYKSEIDRLKSELSGVSS